jgi:DNA-binding GntR family transcriptional regulator
MLAALAGGDRAALVRLCGNHLAPSRQAYLRAQAAFLTV